MLRAAMELQPTNRRVRVGPVTLQVQEWDEAGVRQPADVAVFSHPTGFLGPVWLPLLGRLRAGGFGGRILTYDQRGHGLSSKPDDGYHWQSFVDDARALFRALGIDRAVGIGHSAGATVLACTAALDPGRFRRLVMIDPILFEPAFHETFRSSENTMAKRTRSRRLVWSSRREIFDSYRSREPYSTWTAEALSAYIEHGTFERPDGEIELLCPGRIEARVYEHSASIDGFGHLERLDIPVLLVRGEHSGSFDAARADRALGCLRKGRLVTVEGTTHYVPMERPDEVAALVLEQISA